MPRQAPNRVKQIQIRLNEIEHAAIALAAGRDADTISQWIRVAIRDRLKAQGVQLTAKSSEAV